MADPYQEDQLEEAHQLLLEIEQAQLEAMTLFQGVEARFTLIRNIANRLVEIKVLRLLGKFLVRSSKEQSM
ncbi:hypothetical protein JCGZ_22057 [Jatropha curcas]|uniref:Uncharacterized protein n=1 Tax=Jatropha curcas TaxID=180498 RepID=A0A067K408_JATCU|nr:hypothetical protein JCGZ_22057 [Jatropha curcas]